MPTYLWPSSSLLTVVDSGQRTHLVCLPHCPWTLSHADWSLLLSVADCPSASPFANYLSGFSQNCLSYPTSGLVRDLESKPFVWFRAKTDKGIVCLADHLHSVTVLYSPSRQGTIDKILTGTATPRSVSLGVIKMKVYLMLHRYSEVEPHLQMQLKTGFSFFRGKVLPKSRKYSQGILSLARRAKIEICFFLTLYQSLHSLKFLCGIFSVFQKKCSAAIWREIDFFSCAFGIFHTSGRHVILLLLMYARTYIFM